MNFRPSFVLALSAAVAAFSAFWLGCFALIVPGIFLVAAILLFALRTSEGKRRKGAAIFLAVLAAVTAAVSAGFVVVRDNYEKAPALGGEYVVTGTVSSVSGYDGGVRLTVKDLAFLSEEEYFTSDCKLYLYIYGGEPFDAGTHIRFTASVEELDFVSYGEVNANAVISGVKYRANASLADVETQGKDFDLFGTVRDRMREVLYIALERDTADVAYAMMTGDSSLIDEGLMDNFRYGGVAHIFAVSGLHIATLYGAFAAVFKKVRVRAAVRLPVVSLLLTFYTGVCGFTPSAVRSLIMCLVLALADAGGMKYDALNSVSAASLAVILINPVYFYSVGFRLSVAAAAGIIVLGGSMSRLIGRVRVFPKRAVSAVSVCVSAQIASFPLLLDAFGYVPALSLLLNLIFVPLIGAVFLVLFVCTAVACCLPFAAGYILWLPGLLLSLSTTLILVSDWEILLICGFSFGGCVLLWYAVWFLLSDRINLRTLPRTAAVFLLSAAFVLAMIFKNCTFGGAEMKICARYGTELILLDCGVAEYIVVTGEIDAEQTERILLKEGVKETDGVFLACGAAEANAALAVLLDSTDVSAAYTAEGSGLSEYFRSVPVYETEGAFSLPGIQAEFVDPEGVLLCAGGASVLAAGDGFTADGYCPADILVSGEDRPDIAAACGAEIFVRFEKTVGDYSVYASGDLQIGIKDGIITVKGMGFSDEVRIV